MEEITVQILYPRKASDTLNENTVLKEEDIEVAKLMLDISFNMIEAGLCQEFLDQYSAWIRRVRLRERMSKRKTRSRGKASMASKEGESSAEHTYPDGRDPRQRTGQSRYGNDGSDPWDLKTAWGA